MTPYQIELISKSWSKVAWLSSDFVSRFHVHLFNVDFAAQSLFVTENGNKVTGMMKLIDVSVGLLDQWELIVRTLRELGQRHKAYGVLEPHYPSFGDALLLTLGEILGPEFTPDTREAWAEFYRLITYSMVEGSKT